MFEPSVPIEPQAPRPLAPPRPAPKGRGLGLIHEVRLAQTRRLRLQGAFYGASAFISLTFAGALVANARPGAGVALLALGPLVALTCFAVFGVWLVRRRLGDDERTARLLAERAPDLSLDLLAAVELSRALGRRDDFSPELARAFLDDVDRRATRHSVSSLLDPRPLRTAAGTLSATLLAAAITLGMVAEHVVAGVVKAFAPRQVEAVRKREPITGDVKLTYQYPEYTGLERRTVEGTAGDVSAPAGTEVTFETRADRDVDEAVLVVNGAPVPLTVKGRALSGRFVLEASGQYHVAFMDGRSVEAEGPDLPIVVEVDAAPRVQLTAPDELLELDAKTTAVKLQYEASDDFGLQGLELVYKPAGGVETRVALPLDEARAARGTFGWNVAALGLKPGGEVRYFVEAKDGNTVRGPQKGVSKTQVLKLYSAAEHRREALRKAEALWERLVAHLADRQESADRVAPLTVQAVTAGLPLDERAAQLAKDLLALADALGEERDPMPDLVAALSIIGKELDVDTRLLTQRRASLRRNAALARDGAFDPALSFALTSRLAADLAGSEKNVLYLEALLDRARLTAIRELAQELKEERRELTRLVEEFQKTNDPAVRDALLEQMQELKARMRELQQRMAEMARGLRDEFMNEEALSELADEENLDAPLDEIERLVREGKADEALKKMQELSMQLDEMFDRLEEGAETAEQNADPELAKAFQAFSQELEATAAEQQQLADQTRGLREKARAAAKERIARQGEPLKRELSQKLDEIERSFQADLPDRASQRLEEQQQKALQNLRNTRQALEANDFDLAAESARELSERAQDLERTALDQAALDRAVQLPEALQRESRKLAERTARDARRAQEVADRLDALFPPPSQSLDAAEQQQLKAIAKQQQKLGEKGEQLKQQMSELSSRAPLFDDEAKQQLDQAAQRMGSAGERLDGKDVGRGASDQQGALQALQQLQQQLQQAEQRGGKGQGGLPRPLRPRRSGSGRQAANQKVEIPDEDPGANPREFRKDVMDAMKQGAPDRYREQNKKYYEELVK
ncbi:MAG: DUF4175 family protein [Myxococcaceae bacterium]|nr:DUF4175 family protein [Myxococcaceae bacterium]